MLKRSAIASILGLLAFLSYLGAFAATIAPPTHKTHSKSHKITETPTAQKKMARMQHSSKTAASRNRSSYRVSATSASTKGTGSGYRVSKRHGYGERFYVSSFADNQVEGDVTAGEDPIVRAAAVLLLCCIRAIFFCAVGVSVILWDLECVL